MRSLKAALILFGAITIAEGIWMWVNPNTMSGMMGITDFANLGNAGKYIAYILALLGSGFVASGVLFILAGLNPLQNINAVRFAVLWTCLLLLGQIYAILDKLTTFNDTWYSMLVVAIFLIAFLIFYPWKKNQT
jgi:hypothetical protein